MASVRVRAACGIILLAATVVSAGCSSSGTSPTTGVQPFRDGGGASVARTKTDGGSVYFTGVELRRSGGDDVTVTGVEVVGVEGGVIGDTGFATWTGSSGAPTMSNVWPAAGFTEVSMADVADLSGTEAVLVMVELTLPPDSGAVRAVASGVTVLFIDPFGREGSQTFEGEFLVCRQQAECIGGP